MPPFREVCILERHSHKLTRLPKFPAVDQVLASATPCINARPLFFSVPVRIGIPVVLAVDAEVHAFRSNSKRWQIRGPLPCDHVTVAHCEAGSYFSSTPINCGRPRSWQTSPRSGTFGGVLFINRRARTLQGSLSKWTPQTCRQEA